MKQFLTLLLLFLSATAALAQARALTGTVQASDTGEPLIGASVSVVGTLTGTVTDVNGEFQLDVTNDATIEISYTGYAPKKIQVGAQTSLTIKLENSAVLDEVVVIGYGATKKSNITGAIVSVKPEDLRKVPTTNVVESLQGRLPGVDITRSSGEAGAGINIAVRGNRSLTASNNPLFIVDGIQYNSIQDINPNDIASLEVLKDAASTAIYGSRGANGVILVTTKKGSAGKTRVSFNTYAGVSQAYAYPEVQNAQEYINLRRQANVANGKWMSEADDSKIFNPYEMERIANGGGTVWPDLFLRDGGQQDYQLGITSGTDKTKLYVSLNYFKEKGLVRMDGLDRYSVRVNLDHSVYSWLKVGTQNQVTFYDQSFRRDPMNIANKINPLLDPYLPDGSIDVFPNNGKDINPLSDETLNNYENRNRTNRTFSSIYADLTLFRGMTFRSNLGATFANSRTGIYRGSTTVDRNGSVPEAIYQTGNSLSLNWENILNYSKEFNDHSISITAVQSYLSNRTEEQTAQGRNQLLSYQLYYALGNANDQLAISSNYVKNVLLSYTGRIQYGYKDKYLLQLTARTDGASQLSEGNKWALFPSVSAAWRITQEDFLSNSNLISDLKLRASYGVSGNAAVDPYSSQTNLIRTPYGFDETQAIGYTFGTRVGNPDLNWELSSTVNVGLDFGLFNNRLTGSVDWYDTKTKNLLLNRLLPLSSGFTSVTENIGRTSNKGVEIALNAVAVNTQKLRWNVGINWFANKERIVELATGANDIANGWFIGQPTQSFYDFEKIGIWQLDEADEAALFGQKPGDIRVKDQNGDGVISAADDRIIVGSPRPDWSASLNSDLTVGNFDFSFQIFARTGQEMIYEYATIYDPSGNENSLRHDYWTPENPTNDYPRPDAAKSRSSTLYLTSLQYKDGSFLKLRNMTIGYTLPESLTQKARVSNLRLYLSGRNLWVKSQVDNYDSERGGAMSFPIQRLLIAGANLEF